VERRLESFLFGIEASLPTPVPTAGGAGRRKAGLPGDVMTMIEGRLPVGLQGRASSRSARDVPLWEIGKGPIEGESMTKLNTDESWSMV
jgi:hypothetical protein